MPRHAARAVRRGVPVARTLAFGLVASLAYLGLADDALGPSSDLPQTAPSSSIVTELTAASITYSGVDPVINGSVDHLFQTASFTGPNRAEKTDRFKPDVDVVAFARNFEEARTRLAELRAADADPDVFGQSRVAALEEDADTPEVAGPRMSVAQIEPSLIEKDASQADEDKSDAAAALDAIASIAPQTETASLAGANSPMPAVASEQLAYARAVEPEAGSFSTTKPVEVSDKEKWCLATAIYFEARGESYRGQVAVAQVVMNRVKDRRYPDTICGVVFQNEHRRNACQFSFACDGIPETATERKPWELAQDIAERYLNGELYLAEVGNATHYHATYVRPAWAPRMEKVTQIGTHIFFRFKRGWLFG